ncbi:MAG: sugar phosphate isomerase/epimerase [Chloroflexi bacterium]|nr:sugar phosphate isomerase/epimerase [Chloroflexota bacterium]
MQVGAQLYIYQQRSAAELGRPFEEALRQVLAEVHEAGYAGVELPLDVVGTSQAVASTGDLLSVHDLQVASVYANAKLHAGNPAETVWTLLEQMAEVKYLGVRTLVVNPLPERGRVKTEDELTEQARWLDQLGSQLQGRGLNLALHFHAPELRDDGRELWIDLDRTTRANLSLCLDVDWAWRGGIDPRRILDRYADRVVELHVRDAKGGKWVQALGEGDYDYDPIIRRLESADFDGWVYVELADEPGMVWTRSTKDNLKRSRGWVRERFGA